MRNIDRTLIPLYFLGHLPCFYPSELAVAALLTKLLSAPGLNLTAKLLSLGAEQKFGKNQSLRAEQNQKIFKPQTVFTPYSIHEMETNSETEIKFKSRSAVFLFFIIIKV